MAGQRDAPPFLHLQAPTSARSPSKTSTSTLCRGVCCACGGGDRARRSGSGYVPWFVVTVFIVAMGTLAELSPSELLARGAEYTTRLVDDWLGVLELRVPLAVASSFVDIEVEPGEAPALTDGIVTWLVGAWSSCDGICGNVHEHREVTCSAGELCGVEPDSTRSCYSGPCSVIDETAQAVYIAAFVLVLVVCCSCVPAAWCCIKSRRARWGRRIVHKKGHGDQDAQPGCCCCRHQDSDVAITATFVIVKNTGGNEVDPTIPRESGGGEKPIVRWRYDEEQVEKWLNDDGPTPGKDAGDAGDAEKPSDLEAGNGDVTPKSPEQQPSVVLPAYPVGERLDYLSSTLQMWIAGTVVEESKAIAATLHSNIDDSVQPDGDLCLQLHTNQVRWDVNLDEVQPALQVGETVELFDGSGWIRGSISLVSSTPTLHGYVVETPDGTPRQRRATPAQLRCYCAVGDPVEVYLGEGRGWVRAAVVGPPDDPHSVARLDLEFDSLRFRVSPQWRSRVDAGQAGPAQQRCWTEVHVTFKSGVDGLGPAPQSDVWLLPMFLARRGRRVESL